MCCSQVEISEVCPVPLVLGEQLTHIELERLSMIGPEEFIDDLRKIKKTEVPALPYVVCCLSNDICCLLIDFAVCVFFS